MKPPSDLETLRWSPSDNSVVALTAVNALFTLKLYREEVVDPALDLLTAKLTEYDLSDQPEHAFAYENIADIHHSTLEGFLLTTQSMYERGLRRMMVAAAASKKLGETKIESIKKAQWTLKGSGGLQHHFEFLFDASLASFGVYNDLDILQQIGSALRHGDGPSAVKLHNLCPSLWKHWLPPGAEIPLGQRSIRAPSDAPPHPSIDVITWTAEVLAQMMRSVQWFWEDMEFVRCNSFTSKTESIDRMLDELRAGRAVRESNRVWWPG